MIPMPDPQKAVELIRTNGKEIEKRFVRWARDYHRQTGRFAEKEDAEKAIPGIMVDYVFEEMGDASLDPQRQKITKKVLERILKMAGMFELEVEVVATGGEIRAQMNLDKGIPSN